MQQTNIDSQVEEGAMEEDLPPESFETVEPKDDKADSEIVAESSFNPSIPGLQTDGSYYERQASQIEQQDLEIAKKASLKSNSQFADPKEYRAAERWQALLKPSEQDRISEADSITGEIGCETVLRLSNEFAPIIEKDADTLLYIGPPPRATNQDDHELEHIQSHFYRPYLLRSETLKKVGSAQFTKFLGPMSARVERKLKKLEIHKRVMQPEKIKYYIDLRPMLDDEEALLILTELTSTPAILTWHTKSNKYGIPPELICGRDNLNIPEKPRHRWSMTSEDENAPSSQYNFKQFVPITVRPNEKGWTPQPEPKKSSTQVYQDKIAALRQQAPEPDYSPLRHHVAIERLLHAIAGEDPRLDSAPKVWTYFSIAKYFDCANHPRVNSWITTWLLSSNNSNFIQSNPEVVYRLASGIYSPNMLRCTFAMLVGERALLRIQNPHSPQMPNKSVHGRSFALLDDDDLNRIDHAVPSLIRQVKTVFDKLTDPDLWWITTLAKGEKEMLDSITPWNGEEKQILNSVYENLSDYVRRMIFSALHENLVQDLAKVSDEYVRNRQIYHSLPLNARIYTQTFWSELRQRGFISHDEPGALLPKNEWECLVANLKREGIIPEAESMRYVSMSTLYESFSMLNKMLLQRQRVVDSNGDYINPNYHGQIILGFDTVDEYGRPLPEYPSSTQMLPTKTSNWSAWADHDSAHRQHQRELRSKADLQTFPSGDPNVPGRSQIDAGSSSNQVSSGWNARATDSTTDASALGGDMDYDLVFTTPQPKEVVMQTDDSDNKNKNKNIDDASDIPDSWEDCEGFKPYPMADQAAQFSNEADEDPMFLMTEKPQVLRVVPETGLYSTESSLPFRPAQSGDMLIPEVKEEEEEKEGEEESEAVISKIVRFKAGHNVIDEPSSAWTPEDALTSASSENLAKMHRVQKVLADADRRSITTIRSRHKVPPQKTMPSGGFFYDPRRKKEFGLISAPSLLNQLSAALSECIQTHILNPGYVADGTCDLDIPIQELDTLLCLTDDEWKYLPLWAGGFDDGSGGVFASDELGGGDLPDALDVTEGGFRGGPTAGLLSSGAPTEVGDGVYMVDVSDFGDEDGSFEDIKTDEGVSTVGKASRAATDGTRGDTSTVMSMDE